MSIDSTRCANAPTRIFEADRLRAFQGRTAPVAGFRVPAGVVLGATDPLRTSMS